MAKEKLTAKNWKFNKELENLIENSPTKEVADYIKSPAFTEQDYIGVMSGLYKDLNPYGFISRGEYIHSALGNSPYNKPEINDKVVDLMYDVLNYKREWNKSKLASEKLDLSDHTDNIRTAVKRNNISSKKIHELISDPQYMLEDKYSPTMSPPGNVLHNDNIKPEHLYKFLEHHPEHVDHLVSHEHFDPHLEKLIFDNPKHVQKLSNSNIEYFLSKKKQKEDDGKLNLPPHRAKLIAENAHDKLYNHTLSDVLDAMEPADKKDFIDRKLGITGGKVAGLGAWRTNDETRNEELAGQWDDWDNGPEYDEKFAKRIAASSHLSDDQAEHIKRHGKFDSKYELYHNKHVDPKHGVEMFKLWHDNQEDKGYNAEQLQEKYRKNKDDVYTIDDIDPNLIDDDDLLENVDESTREGYTFSDWADDNEDKIIEEMDLDDDDYEKIEDKLREEWSDWTAPNPNFNKELDDHYQKLIDAAEQSDSGTINMNQVPEITGKHPKNLFISHLGDENGNITAEDIEEHSKEENPEEVDFSDHEDFTISEHPDYDERFSEIANDHKRKKLRDDPFAVYEDWYEEYNNSDDYQNLWQENLNDARQEAAREHFDELYASSHQDDRFIPEHLHSHIPNFEEIKSKRKKAIGEPTDFLDKNVPKRSYEHPYGDDQHLHEYLKDYADANGGSIDIGRMHKLMPNQGDVWKKIFGSNGKITSDEIQSKINDIKKTPYAISYGKWDGNKMQNINGRDQVIFRLDHTNESLKPLQEDPELFSTFKKVQEVSKRSGHPTKDNTIAWARVDTTDPNHWMIDEVQSDFGKTVVQYLKDNNAGHKADHVQKISDYHKNWREALINRVLNEAKKHGVSKVSTHSPESKASHTGAEKAHTVYQDSYKKIPRRMGFKPAPAQTLPLTEKTKEGVFNKERNAPTKENLANDHKMVWEAHKEQANLYANMAENSAAVFNQLQISDNLGARIRKFKELSSHHENLAEKHKARAKEYGIDHDAVSVFPLKQYEDYSPSEIHRGAARASSDQPWHHRLDESLNKPAKTFDKPASYHEGHTYNIKPNLVKALLDIVEDLVKFEYIRDNAENDEIKKRASVSIDLIENMLGYEKASNELNIGRRAFSDNFEKAEKLINKPQHNDQIRKVADEYAASKGLSLNHNIPYNKVDEQRAGKIAEAYHQASHNPNHPAVQRAYGALIKETGDQFKHMLKNGLKVSKMQPGQENPYKSSKDLFHDIQNNNHMWYYPTEQGFGSGTGNQDHPLLQPTEHLDAEGKPMLANDLFRIVHDYFGHAKEGVGFGPHGEEHAWKHHMQMYSPNAQKALTSETRGQNSWVNFGPHGEQNRKNPANTIYADQKATILPEWTMRHGPESVYAKLGKSEDLQKAIGTDEDANPLMNRIEDKFFLRSEKLNDIVAKLRENLPNGDIDTSTRYSINQTIYLDNRDLDSFQDNMMGVKPRFKVRIRRYNPNGEGWENVAYVELKIKEEDGMTRKLRVRIPESLIDDVSNGKPINLNDALVDLNRDVEKTTLWKRVALINSTVLKYGFKKQLVVEYNRRAYSSNNLRITVDDSLKYHSFKSIEKDVLGYIKNSEHWKSVAKPTKKLMSNDLLILEVKHEGEIPSWLRKLLKESKANSVSFSKYCAAITTFILNKGNEEGRIQQQKKVGAYEIINMLHSKNESIVKSENDLTNSNYLQVDISIFEEDQDLDKSEYYSPTKVNERHPTKPYVAKMHPDTGLAWHHDEETARRNDEIINNPEMRQKFLNRLPTATHRAGMEAIMNMVAQSPTRHFIPSRDQGKEKIRARHIKSLILNPESAKIDLSNNILNISMPRHGTYGGFSTWSFNLKPKGVAKNEINEFETNEQRADFEITERLRLRGNLRKYRRSSRNIKKSQYRIAKLDSGNSRSGDLAKGAARRLYGKFDPVKELGEEGAKETADWIGGGSGETFGGHDPRKNIPEASPNARLRMLNKLSRRTTSRRNAETGEREYLLHRQLSQSELDKYKKGDEFHNHQTHSSWTPFLGSITESTGIYPRSTFDPEDKQSYNHIISAWIPENKIKSFLPQYGRAAETDKGFVYGPPGKNVAKEQEVVVRPGIQAEIHKIHKDTGESPKEWTWKKTFSKSEKLEKAIPKKIQLQEGRHKGKVVNVLGETTMSGKEGFNIVPQRGSSPMKNIHGNEISGSAFWDKNRKHKVLGRGIKPSKLSPPTAPASSFSSSGATYYDSENDFTAKGKITSKHSHPAIPHSAKQKQLIHGIDLGKIKQQDKGWTSELALSGFGKNGKGKSVVVKGHIDPHGEAELGDHYSPGKGLSTAQREALYHNMAHNVFGLGKFVPATAVVKHGNTHYSVMEKIPGAQHYERYSTKHNKVMKDLAKNGDVQKLAIMNLIMGNSDRHGGNFMISPKGFHLIDHGLTFNYNANERDIFEPAYLDYAYGNYRNNVELHPNTVKWLKGIDLNKTKQYLKTHKIDPRVKNQIIGALQKAKNAVQLGDLRNVFDAIADYHAKNVIED